MAWTWQKSWSSSDDGSVFGGADIENIQSDISSQTVDITTAQTITGGKTFSGAVNLPATGVIIGTANQGDIFYDDGTDLARRTPGTSGQFLKTQGAGTNPVWANAAIAGVTKVIAASDSVSTTRADYVCDGTADDVQIQQAIDALDTAGKGGRVLLLEGTYVIDATLTLAAGDEDIILEGCGFGTVLQAKTNLNDEILLITGDRVTIKNMKIENSTNAQSTVKTAVNFSGADWCLIENCWINARGATDEMPFEIDDCDYIRVVNNKIVLSTGGGSNEHGGILFLTGASLYALIRGNFIDGSAASVNNTACITGGTTGFGRSVVANNVMLGEGTNLDYGIYLHNNAGNSGNVISGNQVYNDAANGVIIVGTNSVRNIIDGLMSSSAVSDTGTETIIGDNGLH